MSKKGPKTLKGVIRKIYTGDGRKLTPTEKYLRDAEKNIADAAEMLGGKKRRGRKKR